MLSLDRTWMAADELRAWAPGVRNTTLVLNGATAALTATALGGAIFAPWMAALVPATV
jgi:hypothetical protein